jgi:hypothetical protein
MPDVVDIGGAVPDHGALVDGCEELMVLFVPVGFEGLG